MTEADWDAAEDPIELIGRFDEYLMRLEQSDSTVYEAVGWNRKLALWEVACCRRVEHLLIDVPCCTGLDSLENYHEGTLTPEEMREATKAVGSLWLTRDRPLAPNPAPDIHALDAVYYAMSDALTSAIVPFQSARHSVRAVEAAAPRFPKSGVAEQRAQADLLREVFGNPFRPVALEPAWLTSEVRALAHAIYAERAWDRMPILADALQEAGCENEDVLAHCRSATAPHVRGCWVVDLLLGKGGPA
jgi:hypothetical protein